MKLKHVVILGLMVIMLAPVHSFAVQSQLQTLQANLGVLQGNLQTLSEQLNALKEKIALTPSVATGMSGGGDASVDNGGDVGGHVSGDGVTGASQAFADQLSGVLDPQKASAGAAAALKRQDKLRLENAVKNLKSLYYEYKDLHDFLQVLCTELNLEVDTVLKKDGDDFTVSLPNAVLMKFSLEQGDKYQFGNVITQLSNIQSTFPRALTIDLNMEDEDQNFSATQLVSYLGSDKFISKNNKNIIGYGQTWWAFKDDQEWLFQTQHDASNFANCETPSKINAQSALRIYVASNHLNLETSHKLRLYTFVLGLAQAAMTPAE